MAETALPAPQHPPRRRVLGGMLDADGWPWAFVKAAFWFLLIIIMIGYIPDRAYYFTVQRTVDIGLLAWSPINFCPPSNGTLPCPAPSGATLAWQTAPQEIRLPAARADGVAANMGVTFVYAGGTDGTAAVADVYVTHAVAIGNLDKWSAAPPLPEARSDAASAVIGTTLYVIGGYGPDGKPTDTAYSITVDNDGVLGDWQTVDKLKLPEPRAGAAAVAVSDGIVLFGGTNGTAATDSVWKIQQAASGTFGSWTPQSPLYEPNMDGVALHVGDYVYVLGGTNASGEIVSTVQEALVGGPEATTDDPNVVTGWRVSAETNLPGPRTNMAGFTANGGIYLQGGSDAGGPQPQTIWTTPDAEGVITGWKHLDQTDLGEGVSGSAAVTAGSNAILMAGETPQGLTGDLARADLAPQEPFFQLGVLGIVVPGLKLAGEIGQQIGYLNAFTVGLVNFGVLIAIGYAFNHKEQVRAAAASIRRRRRG
jgi:hypothetical protein